MADYDETIKTHYKTVADQEGLLPTSTMADLRTRQLETELILRCLKEIVLAEQKPSKIADVGCGNGYTLEVLYRQYPQFAYTGLEYSQDLRLLAKQRFSSFPKIKVLPIDIRDKSSYPKESFDFILCQRVLINLLNRKDQDHAFNNIIDAVKKGGVILFIEAFDSGLRELNEARAELGQGPIPPAYHNLYLEDDFFISNSRVKKVDHDACKENFLSTHYFVTRVFHPYVWGDKEFKRNSHFVRFFSEALAPNVGNFSPLRCVVLKRVQ